MFYLSGGFAFLPCRLLFAVVYKRIGKMQIYCIVIRLSVLTTLLLVMLQFSLRFLANFFGYRSLSSRLYNTSISTI